MRKAYEYILNMAKMVIQFHGLFGQVTKKALKCRFMEIDVQIDPSSNSSFIGIS